MNTAVKFLGYLAQAIAAITLYDDGHPARERAIDRAYRWLRELQDEVPTPTFMFLGDEVLLDSWPLRAMRNWDWSSRMSKAGVQRVEFIDRVTRPDFEAFLLEVFVRLVDEDVSTAEVRQGRPSNIRYGEVRMKGDDDEEGKEVDTLPVAKLGYSLKEEIEAIQWLHGELKDDKGLHLLEASGIVQSLSVAMHSDHSYLIPLVRLKEYDQYTTTHSLNVSVLTMALAEFLGLAPREVRAFGIAGLMHDLGKVTIPNDILNKPGKLTEQERAVINSHTVEGARIIIETERDLDVAAVVAYEHHIRIDGAGYPSMLYKRASHPASVLVHVCDVFDALRTNRPYRDAMSMKRALSIIEEGAGSDFDADVAHAFLEMMKRWNGRIADVDPDEPEVMVLEGLSHGPLDDSDVYDVDAALRETVKPVDLEDDGMLWVETDEPDVADLVDAADEVDDDEMDWVDID